MQALSMWESVLLGIMAVLVLIWSGPGIKGAMARSKQAKSDWLSLLMPLGLLILFVVFLVITV